ncbi:MAG: sugar kinase [Phycisphaerales bacterium]|nr:sugar kinase [Phycisphaerales bacterium]
MSLIVTGTIGIDTVETPSARRARVLGGSAAYFAAAACPLTPVRLVGVVGGDWPAEHRAMLEGLRGADLRGLETRPAGKTFAWGGKYHENMNVRETLFTDLGVVGEAPPTVPSVFADSQYVFLGNTHPSVQRGLLTQLPNRKIAIADTMDLWINIAHDELMQLLGEVDGLVLNDSEAALLTGVRNAVTAGERILAYGPKFVVVKKGEHGAVLVHREGVAAVPAFPATEDMVVDPTGAGDSFAGGMMGHIARVGATDFETLQDALTWGTVMASFTIGGFSLEGLRDATPDAIAKRHAEFRSAARIA